MFISDEMKLITARTEIPLFLARNRLNTNIVEIGVRYGYNFQQLLTCEPKLAVAVDSYAEEDQDTGKEQLTLDQLYRDTYKRFLHYPNVKIIRDRSERAVDIFDLFFFDYVYIDAGHTQEACYNDMHRWWPKVRQGGVMAGHDYLATTAKDGSKFGVIEAVAEFIKVKKIPLELFHHTKEGYRSWMLYKRDGE